MSPPRDDISHPAPVVTVSPEPSGQVLEGDPDNEPRVAVYISPSLAGSTTVSSTIQQSPHQSTRVSSTHTQSRRAPTSVSQLEHHDPLVHLSGGSPVGNRRGLPISTVSTHHPTDHANPGPTYSKCTGTKRALCIGINYCGQDGELRGCVNDARNMRTALKELFGYRNRDILLLADDGPHSRIPTKRNILAGIQWLVKNAKPNDSLFFHYSGHGGQMRDKSGDEADNLDEVIYPLDYKKGGCISDDDLNRLMVQPLPARCRLTAIFDSCHSGSVLDLPYLYHSDGRVKSNKVGLRTASAKATFSDVVLWSGCRDSETSADTQISGQATGAMSNAFLTALKQNPKQSYQQLLTSVRDILSRKYSQKPQLSSSLPIDTHLRFFM